MKEEIKLLAKYRLSRAKETFNDAILLLRKGSFHSAINRLYYTAFYAARALLATKDIDSSKHSGVIALFQQHFVKNGLFQIDLSKALPHSFEERLDSDYEDFITISKEEIESIKNEVSRFIAECEKVLNQLMGGKNETKK